MTYATVEDVSTRLGRPITDEAEVTQVTAWLGDIEALILARVPDLAARIAEGTLSNGTVVMIEANSVIRKIRNPEGKKNERIDDYSFSLNDANARGDLFLTDDEWDLLIPQSSSGAFSTRPYGAPDFRSWSVYPWGYM